MDDKISKGIELLKRCETYHCFTLDYDSSEVFEGDFTTLIEKYLKANPSKTFRVWLIDLGLRIKG